MTAYCSRALHVSKLVRPVRTEDELELKENRIDLAIGEEEVRFEKIMIVLLSQLREFRRIPA